MPDRSWLCGLCEENNPPFTEVCRNCCTPFSLDAEKAASRLATIRHFNPSGTTIISDGVIRVYAKRIDRMLTAVGFFLLLAIPFAVAALPTLFPALHGQISRYADVAFRLSYLIALGAGLIGFGCAAALNLPTRKNQVGNDGSGMVALIRLYFTRETSVFGKALVVLAVLGLLTFLAAYLAMLGVYLMKR